LDTYTPERHHLDRRADEIAKRVAAGGDPDDLLNPPQAAHCLNKSEQWLALGRSRGYGPPFVRLGRTVRYRRRDLVAWLESRLHHSTAEYDTQGAGRPRTVPRCPGCGGPLPRHLREAAE
jgi:predicted DNA-binding transcriptional regulator AlpA